MATQFHNLAETYGIGFYKWNGSAKELKKIKEKSEETKTTQQNKKVIIVHKRNSNPLQNLPCMLHRRGKSPSPRKPEQSSEKLRRNFMTLPTRAYGKYYMALVILCSIVTTFTQPIGSPLLIPIHKRSEFSTPNQLMEFNDNRTPKRIHVTASPRLKEKFKEINKMVSTTTPMPPKPVKLKWLIEKQSTLSKTTSPVNKLPKVSQPKIEKQRSSDTYVQRNKPKAVPVNIPAPTIVQKRESVPNNDLPAFWCAHAPSSLWTIPDQSKSPYCHPLTSNKKWKDMRISLFSHAQHTKELIAHHCSVKKVVEVYYTNLLGDRFLQMERLMISISKEDCSIMAQQHLCPSTKETMQKIDNNSWSTQQVINMEFPGRFQSLFSGEQRAIAINCLVQRISLFFKPQTLEIFSPTHNMGHCKFTEGSCTMYDNTTIIWETDCPAHQCRKCKHQYTEQMDGLYKIEPTRIIWLSKSKEQALTFEKENAPNEFSCHGDPITLSEQGFGILTKEYKRMFLSRGKRTVEEDQLASELTASELTMNQLIERIFIEKCKKYKQGTNPTLLARQLLQKENIAAKWIGPRTMQLYTCAEIGMNMIRTRRTTNCYKYIPVEVLFYNRTLNSFLDPVLRILSSTAPPADCGRFRYMYLEYSKNTWYKIDTKTAIMDLLNNSAIHTFHNNLTQFNETEIHPVIFHEWLIHPDDDKIPFLHIDELTQSEEWKTTQKTDEHHRALTLGAIPGGLPGLAKEWFRGLWEMLVHYWMIFSCAFSTFLFIRDVLVPILWTYFLTPTLKTIGILKGRQHSQTNATQDAGTEFMEIRPRGDSIATAPTPPMRFTSFKRRHQAKDARVQFSKSNDSVSLASADSPFGNPLRRLQADT
uniref:Uncharacterized protein n=1 Tax=Meloidogyne enterolobii TaxID=390850 RepID=A0A6V7VWM5_MELEN|nr:unnamed protein product [Meloidogyne enterolobii]